MRIYLKNHNVDHTRPLMPVKVFTGSALPIELVGISSKLGDITVTGVSVTVTNADGTPYTATATKTNGEWLTAFLASCFTRYGFVTKGFLVTVTGTRSNDVTMSVKFAISDFEVVAASASATAGDTSITYVTKGGDVYLKSSVVSSVQHYVKQVMSYDEEMEAWGANWTGDYILVNGTFYPFA